MRLAAALVLLPFLSGGCGDDEEKSMGSPSPDAGADGGGGSAGTAGAGGQPADAGAPQLSGQWETLPDLQLQRSAYAAGRIGSKAYLLGGYQGGLTASQFGAVYDVEAQTEEPMAILPTGVASASAVTHDGAISVVGGVVRFPVDEKLDPEDRCQRYTIADDSWAPCASVGNGPTTQAAAGADGALLYLFGGVREMDATMGGGNLVSRIVQRYDAAADEWRAENELPELRTGAAVVVYRGVAYVIGGFAQSAGGGSVALADDVLAYDLAAHAFLDAADERAVGKLPTKRAGLGCAVVGAHAYCLGGFDTDGDNVDAVERLDFESRTWEALPPMPAALSDMTPIAFDDSIVVFGGLDSAFNDVATVYRMR